MRQRGYYSLASFFTIVIIISIYKFIVLNSLLFDIDLYLDEAYYWGWSRSFEFGYYSKPPLIAWVIGLFSYLCGDSELCIKLPALFIYPLTSVIIYLIAQELYSRKIAFFSGITFITLPIVSVSSFIISTDVLLLLFLSLTILYFIKYTKTKKKDYILIAGFFAGFGLLSKYNMILTLLALVLYLIFSKQNREILKNRYFYFALILAALIYLPNLIWNYQNDFVSFSHTKEISQVDKELFSFKGLFAFISSQFVVIGPLFFVIFIYLLINPKLNEDRFNLLYFLSIVFFGVIVIQSFISRAFANWAFPTYIAGIILIVAHLISIKKIRLLFIGILINVILMFAIYHFNTIINLLKINLESKYDPYRRVRGWENLAKKSFEITKNYSNIKFLFTNRAIMAQFIYYIKPHPFDSVIWNPKNKMQNHYDLTTSMQNKIGEDFILIDYNEKLHKSIINSFDVVKKIASIEEKPYKNYAIKLHIFYLKNFLGYRK